MISVTPDILKQLAIENCFLRCGDQDVWCTLWRISSTDWEINLTEKIAEDVCELFCKINNAYVSLPGKIRLLESEYMYLHQISFDNSNANLFQQIKKIERLFTQSEKRKEKRFEIDLINYDSFGLIARKQAVYIENTPFPCVVNNVSFGGALITTANTPNYRPRHATLFLSFKNPIVNVSINAHIKHIAVKGQFMMMSLQFLEQQTTFIERVMQYEKYFSS